MEADRFSPAAVSRLATLLPAEGPTPSARGSLARLIAMLCELPPPPDPAGLFPRFQALRGELRAAAAGDDGERLEEALLELYAHLHGHEAPYTPAERARVDATGGYWGHAGGLSPVLLAADLVEPGWVSADLGAGNGLQLLLLQLLAPHARSVQVEISSRMLEAGRGLQGWLGIAPGRVEWRQADVTACAVPQCDLLYLYRPVRLVGGGRRYYERLAAELSARDPAPVILSVADCLVQFLPDDFERFYFDGHLAAFRQRDGGRARSR